MRFPFVRSPLQFLRTAPRAVRGLVLGVLCALLVQGLFALGWLHGMERGTLDALFRLRGPRFGSPAIVLVMADDATVSHFKQWPLPRRVHADLVRHLKKAGAKTIAYDLLFPTASSSPKDDAAFERACSEAGNVVQACAFHIANNNNVPAPVTSSGIVGQPDERFAISGRRENSPNSRISSAVWMNAPLPALMQSAPAIGHINIHPEKDGVLRRIPHVFDYRGRLYPSLALAAAAHYLDLKSSDIRLENSALFLNPRKEGGAQSDEVLRLPIDAGGETWVNWSGGYHNFPTYSMLQVLSDEVPPETFKDRIVLVGAIAQGTFEWRATPFSPAQPAVELQANALDNILLQRPIIIAPNVVRFFLTLFLATFTGALVAPRLDLGASFVLFGACLLAWLAAVVCFARYNYYLPFSPAMLAAALTYSLAMAINYRDEWEANWRADASVAALARGGALMISGHNRSELETVIRSTAQEALQANEVHLIFDSHEPQAELLRSILQAVAQQSSVNSRSVLRAGKNNATRAERHSSSAHGSTLLPSAGKTTWIATPISINQTEMNSSGAAGESSENPSENLGLNQNRARHGYLVAIGQREGRAFTSRDAAVMETLADQASLALESLDYYELLQSRVDLANRDLRQAYGVLSSQSTRFMAAVESMDDAFLICDATHRVVFINGTAQPVLGDATPQLGDYLPDIFAQHGLAELALLFDQLDTASDSTHQEYSVGERVLAMQLTPLAETGNNVRTGSMLIVSDVTAQRDLDRMKTDFVGFVAHELRSPLGVIMGYASLLQQSSAQSSGNPANGNPANDLQNEVLSAIDRQCRRLNRLVGDLLDIARLEGGHALDLRRADLDFVTLCERVIETQRAIITRSDLSLSLQCANASIPIFADSDRLEQILVNLLSNAVKYSPTGGQVVVAVAQTDSAVELRVSDQGMGMTREQTDNLFQKFYRTPEAKAQGIKGTGLGLFLVRQLIEAHNGTIQVESELGKGTSFFITFPRRALS